MMRYEQEYRVFIGLNDATADNLYFMRLNERMALREVIVGHRSNLTRQDLMTALKGNTESIALQKARLAFQTFQICKQRNKTLW